MPMITDRNGDGADGRAEMGHRPARRIESSDARRLDLRPRPSSPEPATIDDEAFFGGSRRRMVAQAAKRVSNGSGSAGPTQQSKEGTIDLAMARRRTLERPSFHSEPGSGYEELSDRAPLRQRLQGPLRLECCWLDRTHGAGLALDDTGRPLRPPVMGATRRQCPRPRCFPPVRSGACENQR